jgi:exopolysaccharide biosynthesis WecB/TagA/CpsF family protein
MIIRKEFFFGIPVSIFTLPDIESFIKFSVENSSGSIIYGFSLHSIYNISSIPEIIGLGKNAELLISDGRPFYWLLKLFKIPVKSNISIPESVMLTLKIANERKYSILLFGSTDSLNLKACSNLKKEYQNIEVMEGIPGYFDFNKEMDGIRNKISSLNPDILLIGISSPIKEKFVFENRDKLHAKLIIPCGGMIDILAGKTTLTPRFIKAVGLASVYRVIQEPRRLLIDRLKFYHFVFFNFLPWLFWNTSFLRKKNISIIDHYSKIPNG